MAGNPEYQNLDPVPAPPVMTPADTPSSPGNYANVTPHERGTAWYDVQAPLPDLTGVFTAANDLAGSGVLYPQGPRQRMTETMLSSPQGFGVDGYDIDAGWSGGGGDTGWPANVEPPG